VPRAPVEMDPLYPAVSTDRDLDRPSQPRAVGVDPAVKLLRLSGTGPT
jgi:hypothetical protein